MPHEMHASDLIGTLNPRCPDCQMMVREWLPTMAMREQLSDVDGWMLELTHETLSQAVRLAIAAASLCWVPAPTGEFQQELAGQIANELLDHIRRTM